LVLDFLLEIHNTKLEINNIIMKYMNRFFLIYFLKIDELIVGPGRIHSELMVKNNYFRRKL